MSSDEVPHPHNIDKRKILARYNLPDVNSLEFRAEAHRQSLAVAQSPNEEEDQAFIDSLFDDLIRDQCRRIAARPQEQDDIDWVDSLAFDAWDSDED